MQLSRKKGFVVEEDKECIGFLHRANYYRLSAYFIPFKKADGTYCENISFRRIEHLYEFDGRMRSLILQCIEEIELFLRTQFSYSMAHKYGALGYLDATNFSEAHNEDKFIKHLNRCIEENKRSLVVRHHQAKYGGQFPLWVIIEYFSIGMLSYYYADLKMVDQKFFAKSLYSTNPACMKSWLRCITDLRNQCAHSSRLYAWIFTAVPKAPKNAKYQSDRKLFSQIMMLKQLYPLKEQWNSKVAVGIETLLEEYSEDISLRHIGFPENWVELLKN